MKSKILTLNNYFEGIITKKETGKNFVHIHIKSEDNSLHPVDIQTNNPIYVNNTIRLGSNVLYCEGGLFAQFGKEYIKVCPD